MKPVAKLFLGGCAALGVLVIAGLAIFAWFLSSHKGEILARARAARREGSEAGRSLTDAQCVDGALARYDGARGVTGAVAARVWLDGCLETSRTTREFCAPVPPEREFARTVAWRVAQCQGRGFQGDPSCPTILAGIQEHCAKR